MSPALPLVGGELGGQLTLLADQLRALARDHGDDPEARHVGTILAGWTESDRDRVADCFAPVRALPPVGGTGWDDHPGLAVLRDLRRLMLTLSGVDVHWVLLQQAAHATHDDALLEIVAAGQEHTTRTRTWCSSAIKARSAQAITQGVGAGFA